MTVGSICHSIVRKRVIGFVSEKYAYVPAVHWDEFGMFRKNDWYGAHAGKSLVELQKEYLLLAKNQLLNEPDMILEIDAEGVAEIVKVVDDALDRIASTGLPIDYDGAAFSNMIDEGGIQFLSERNSDVADACE
jgi:hypothetical protein